MQVNAGPWATAGAPAGRWAVVIGQEELAAVGAWPGRGRRAELGGPHGVVRTRGPAGTWHAGVIGPGVASVAASPRPRLPLPHRLLSRPLSCSDGVPLPHHRHSRGLQGRALTRPGPGCVQHVSGRAAPAPHPDLRSVSVWGPKGREVWRKVRGAQGGRPAQPEGLGSLSITGGVRCGAPQTSTQQRPAAGNQGPLACREHLGPQPEAVVGRGRPWRPARPCPRPSRTIAPGPVPPPPVGAGCPGRSGAGRARPGGPWVCCRKEPASKGVTVSLYQNRALEQTLAKTPVPWAGLAPCALPQQTPEPACPASPALPPLSCPFASRVVYQDGFYGAEIYVSAAGGGGGCRPGLGLGLLLGAVSVRPAPRACPERRVPRTSHGRTWASVLRREQCWGALISRGIVIGG